MEKTITSQAVNIGKTKEMKRKEIEDAFIAGFMAAGGTLTEAMRQASKRAYLIENKARIGCVYCSDKATYVGLIRNADGGVSKIPLCGNHLSLYGAARPIKHGDYLENDGD